MKRRLLPGLALLVQVAACGPTSPSPSPSPTPTPNTCATPPSAYAMAVTDWWIPACSLAANVYNDPSRALGSPDAATTGSGYSGFISLGFGGRVTVDLGGCISDQPGADLRVFQAVSSEPLSVYVSVSPAGPFTLVEARKPCGERFQGVRNYCDFDLAAAGLSQARYVRVEDGEFWPCPGGTESEGADLDAVRALAIPVAAGPASVP